MYQSTNERIWKGTGKKSTANIIYERKCMQMIKRVTINSRMIYYLHAFFAACLECVSLNSLSFFNRRVSGTLNSHVHSSCRQPQVTVNTLIWFYLIRFAKMTITVFNTGPVCIMAWLRSIENFRSFLLTDSNLSFSLDSFFFPLLFIQQTIYWPLYIKRRTATVFHSRQSKSSNKIDIL